MADIFNLTRDEKMRILCLMDMISDPHNKMILKCQCHTVELELNEVDKDLLTKAMCLQGVDLGIGRADYERFGTYTHN